MRESNKRIAKNTLILYIRLAVTMLVGLFTSRYVLKALGVSDYGLYNVVGSVIGMYAFIAGSLSDTTARFINFEMGKEDGDVNRMFNICNFMHICMAIIILVISETFGIWYINNYLNVAPGKLGDAMFVFQVSITVCCLGIINVPYSSLYNVHEKFLFPALLDIGYTLLRLGLVIFLIYYKGNALRFYALMMSLTTFSNFIIYHYLAYRNWHDIVRWKFVPGWKNYKSPLSFTTYNMIYTMALTARDTGSNLLINFFFGTVVNAAFAVAKSVQGYVDAFVGSFGGAAAPQITQNLAGEHKDRSAFLANNICRITIALTELAVLPLFVEMPFILKLWLKTPPQNSDIFCRIMLFILWFATTSAGIVQVINGSGRIKWFKLNLSAFFLINLPLGYIAFKMGAPAYTILIFFALSDICQRIIQLCLLKKLLHYDVKSFMKEAYVRTGIVLGLMIVYIIIYLQLPIISTWGHILGFLVTGCISLIFFLMISIKKNERQIVLNLVRSKIKR
ncbi:lipopolysaccharide biosynthesis protein [Prevotella sp. AGR2160]|uniref:lipopolysaccharide biosynthesis protein n=1 Tax=Prevotella sp. AGR2160 TaxID=1280674 RepID=UPI0004160195|nr:lipopolysaccharide biosynthesis protein [Prevotella sp. AGR2160]